MPNLTQTAAGRPSALRILTALLPPSLLAVCVVADLRFALLAVGAAPLLRPTWRRRWTRRDPWSLWLTWPLLLLTGDVLLGQPSLWRAGVVALGCAAALTCVCTHVRCASIRGPERGLLVGLAVLTLAVAFLGTIPAEYGADLRIGHDTAYFTRIVHEAGMGRPPRADVVGAILYHPPLEHHFGAHMSPVLYGLAPFLRALPDWRTLAVLRTVLMLSFLGVALLWWRSRAETAPSAWILLGLGVPALWFQPLHTVYLLPLAAPTATAAILGAYDGRVRWMVAGTLATALVREDATLFVGTAVFLVSLARRRRPATALAVAAGSAAWFLLCTRLLMPHFAPSSGEALAALFADVGGSPLGFLSHPEAVWNRIADVEALRSMWVPLRATALLALGSPLALAALPAHGVNLLAGIGGFGTLEPTYHYAVLPGTAIALAGVVALARRHTPSGRIRILGSVAPRSAVLVLWCVGATLSAGDALSARRTVLDPISESARALRAEVRALPASLSVAAPSCWLPHLALHREVFILDRFDEYPGSPDPDLYLVAPDAATLDLAPDRAARYERIVHRLLQRDDLQVVFDIDGWRLLAHHDLDERGERR